MLKADAYGMGAVQVAKATEDVVSAFGVVTLEEARKLKKAGIRKDILLCACACEELRSAIKLGAIVAIHNFEQVQTLLALVQKGVIDTNGARIHIKVDSGMHRLGFDCDGAKNAVRILKTSGFNVEGVYSHLRDGTLAQLEEFNRCACAVKDVYPNAKVHLASTHSLANEKLRFDAVRVGIGAYTGAMSVFSHVLASRRLKAGERVSYGNHSVTRDTNTAVVFGGYADGVDRENPSDVYIDKKPCKVIGDVCMDMFVVDTGDTLARVGQQVALLDDNCVETVARQRKTIEYCVYTSWKGRVKRCYNGQKTSEKNCRRKSCEDD